MSMHQPDLSAPACVICPVCRVHYQCGTVTDSTNVGLKIYITAECPICREEKSPLVALSCGHVVCYDDFQQLLALKSPSTRQATSRSTRRIYRAIRPPSSNEGGSVAVTSPQEYFTPALAVQAIAPDSLPERSLSSSSSNIATSSTIPGTVGGTSIPESHNIFVQASSLPPFAPATYVAAGEIQMDDRQRKAKPKRRKVFHVQDFSNGVGGAVMQPWTRKAKDEARKSGERKRKGISLHTSRSPWAPNISYF